MTTSRGGQGVSFLESLGAVVAPERVCLPYRNDGDLFQAVVPFVIAGLRRNERCLLFTGQEVGATLRDYIEDEATYLSDDMSSGRFRIRTDLDAFTPGGGFSVDSLSRCLDDAATGSDASAGFRIAIDLTALALDPDARARRDMAVTLARFTETRSAVALCMFDRRRLPSSAMLETLRTFPWALSSGRLCRNVYHVPADRLGDSDDSGRILDLTLSSLENYAQQERALHDRLRRMEHVLAASMDGFWVLDSRGAIIEVNEIFSRSVGYSRDELLSMNMAEIDVLENEVEVREHYKSIVSRGYGRFETQHCRKDGSVVDMEVSCKYVPEDSGGVMVCFGRDVTERRHSAAMLRHVNRAIRVLSECSQALTQIQDEPQLLDAICRILVKDGGYRMAWIGKVEHDADKQIRPLASSGHVLGYLDQASITWSDTPRGQGPAGTAARTGRPSVVRFIATDPAFAPWREEALRRGYASTVSIPIMLDGAVFGTLSIHSSDCDAFDVSELALLTELAGDLSYGIETLRTRVEHVRAEEALRTSEQRLELALRGADLGLWDIDLGTGAAVFDERWASMLGYTPEEIEPDLTGWGRRVHPDDIPMAIDAIEAHMEGRVPFYELEHRMRTKNGEWKWILTRGQISRNAAGQLLRFTGTHLDTTARRKAEADLLEAERPFRELLETLQMVACILDATGRVTFCNDYLLNLTGWERSEVLGRGWFDIFIPAVASEPRLQEYLEAVATGIRSDHHIDEIVTRSGERRTIAWNETVFRDSEGRVISVAGVGEDMTDRRRAEESNRRLAIAIEQAVEAMFITDVYGTIQYVNPSFERITGYTSAEAIGQNPRILKSGKHGAEFYRDMWQTISRGEVWRGHTVNRRKDGTLYEEVSTISPVRDDAGVIVNYVAMKRDVSQELRLEEQLRQSQKMEAIGRLAGGVAHDFNNLLQCILGYTHLSLDGLPREDERHGFLVEVTRAAEQAAALVRQLLTFSRRESLQRKRIDLNRVITDMLNMLRRILGEHVELQFTPGQALGFVHADEGQIGQVLVNLCVNARDAMPDGGRIMIGTERVHIDRQYCETQPWAKEGDYVRVRVTDTGPGISLEVQERIFEPFFTTKGVGKGTGLGLATVYGIVQQHDGMVTVDSAPNKGSTFEVYLPAQDAFGVSLEKVADNAAPADGGNETVLLAEDEEIVRGLAMHILNRAGYRVLVAQDGGEAVALFRAHAPEISLALLDVVMPKLSGRGVLKVIREMNPNLPVLLASGYSLDVLDTGFAPDENTILIPKPYRKERLLQIIREALAKAKTI